MDYYLIRGDQIVSVLSTATTDVIAVPLLGGEDAMSLMSASHAQNLMDNLDLTAAEALAALGLADLRETVVKTTFLASEAAALAVNISGLVPYKLVDISEAYSLWQVDGQQADLLRLHAALWAMTPAQTLGLLAVVQVFGVSFYPSAVRTATGMTLTQAAQRRDRIAAYLESLGYTNTAALRAATDENAQMLGIVAALGYTAAQMWGAMTP